MIVWRCGVVREDRCVRCGEGWFHMGWVYIYIYACKEEDDLSLKGSGPVERVDERDERRKL